MVPVHWRIVAGLGTVWILDGLEVTIVGAVASRMTEPNSAIHLTSADIGTAAAIHVAGACVGALLFGRLTDRYGRKKLFMPTLGIYILATVATAARAAECLRLIPRGRPAPGARLVLRSGLDATEHCAVGLRALSRSFAERTGHRRTPARLAHRGPPGSPAQRDRTTLGGLLRSLRSGELRGWWGGRMDPSRNWSFGRSGR